jgi:hypothetical protein
MEYEDETEQQNIQRKRKLEERSRPLIDVNLDIEFTDLRKYVDIIEPAKLELNIIKKIKYKVD